jgi:hypothetical protein
LRTTVLLIALLVAPLTHSQGPASSIRSIDFANFTYKEFINPRTLVNGKEETDADPLYLASVIYGDVTGDNVEEALVVLFTSVRGTAIPYDGYVFTMRNGRPKLLWSFPTGDRADGGLRQMYADNGKLVVELYGKGTRIGGKLYGTEGSACCPSSFTRNRYQWRTNHFRRKGKEEILSNPTKHASLIMPRYSRSERAQ